MSYTVMALIINILFVLIVVAGFFVGFWRGLKKSAVNVAFAVVGVLVAFFSSAAVTNAILGIKISGGVTINQYILDMILSDESISNVVNSVTSLKDLVASLPAALANIFVFIVLTILFETVLYVIYKIIAAIFLKNKKPADGENAPKKHRVWGGVVGGVKTLVLTIFVIAPLTSLCGVVGTLSNTDSFLKQDVIAGTQTEQQTSIIDSLPQPLLDGTSAFANSGFGFFGGIFGFDDAVFDYLSGVNVNGQTVAVRQEIEAYWPAYQLYQDFSTVTEEGSQYTLADLDLDKVEDTVDGILDSGLYETIVVDVLQKVVDKPEDYSFLPQDGIVADILQNVKTDITGKSSKDVANYFSHDIRTLIRIVKNLVADQNNLLQDIMDKFDAYSNADPSAQPDKLNDLLDTLTNDDNFTTVNKMFGDLFSMNLVKAGAKPVVQMMSDMMLGEIASLTPDLPAAEDSAAWTNIANNLADILQSAANVLTQVDLGDLTGGEMQTWIDGLLSGDSQKLESVFDSLITLFEKLETSPLFKTANGTIVDALLGDSLTLPESFKNVEGETVTIDSYSKLFKDVFLPSLNSLSESGLYKKLNDNLDPAELFGFIADQIENDEKFLQKIILPLIQVQPTDQIVKDLLKDNDQIKFSDLDTYDKWENDIAQISILLKNLKNIGIDKDGEPSTTAKQGIEYLFSSNVDYSKFIIALTPEEGTSQVGNILAPLFKAYSMQAPAQNVFTNISTALNGLLQLSEQEEISLQADNSLFLGDDDQTGEVCDIIEKFMPLFKAYQADNDVTFETLYVSQNTAVDDLLTVLQTNATRNSENESLNAGMFAEVYQKLQDKIEEIKSSLSY